MLVKLTEYNSGEPFYLDCRNIRLVQRKIPMERSSSKKKGEETVIISADKERPPAKTFVMTYTIMQNGFQAFDVMEETEEVVEMVNAAHAATPMV